MKINFKILFIVLFELIISSGLVAQTDFKPGYVIKNSGDTLMGNIDYRGNILMSKVCKFKDNNNSITEFSPNDILGFRFIDGKYFVSKEINKEKYFLEYLIKGKVNIYYMKDSYGHHYYLDKDDVALTEIPYEEGVKFVNEKQVYYESTKHILLLNYYMQDAPGFLSQIQSIDRPDHHNLVKLAKNYHNAVCDDEKCIIYGRKVPALKILPEIIFGIAKYSNVEGLNNKYYVQTGIIGHFWMPMSNEKLYFRTGVLFSKLDFEDGKGNSYKIPVQFEYIYPKGILRPRIAYGLNFYDRNYQSISFDLGGNLKLSETLFLSATSDFEFNHKMLIPKGLYSSSYKMGLFMMFK